MLSALSGLAQGVRLQAFTTNSGPVVTNIVTAISSNLQPNRLKVSGTIAGVRIYAVTGLTNAFWLDPALITPGAATNVYYLLQGTNMIVTTNGLGITVNAITDTNVVLTLITNNVGSGVAVAAGTAITIVTNGTLRTISTVALTNNETRAVVLVNGLNVSSGNVVVSDQLQVGGDGVFFDDVIVQDDIITTTGDFIGTGGGLTGIPPNALATNSAFSNAFLKATSGTSAKWSTDASGLTNLDVTAGPWIPRLNGLGTNLNLFGVSTLQSNFTIKFINPLGTEYTVMQPQWHNDIEFIIYNGSLLAGAMAWSVGEYDQVPTPRFSWGFGEVNPYSWNLRSTNFLVGNVAADQRAWVEWDDSTSPHFWLRYGNTNWNMHLRAVSNILNKVGSAYTLLNSNSLTLVSANLNVFGKITNNAAVSLGNGDFVVDPGIGAAVFGGGGGITGIRDAGGQIATIDFSGSSAGFSEVYVTGDAGFIGMAKNLTNIYESGLNYWATNPPAGQILGSTSSNTPAWFTAAQLGITGGGGGGGPFSGGFTNGSGVITADGHAKELIDPVTGWTNLNWTDQTLSTANTNVLDWFNKYLIGNWTVTNGNLSVVGTGPGAIDIGDGDSAEEITITVPTTVASNYTITLPSTNGMTGNVLTLVNGVTAWSMPSGQLATYPTNLGSVTTIDFTKRYSFISTNNNIVFTGVSGVSAGGTVMDWAFLTITNTSAATKTITTPASWIDTLTGVAGATTYYLTNQGYLSVMYYPGAGTNFTYRGGTR